MSGVDPDGPRVITTFLNHQGWKIGLSDQSAQLLEVLVLQTPCAGRVSERGIQTETNNEIGRIKTDNAFQDARACLDIAAGGDRLREWIIVVEALSGAAALFILESAEIRISKPRMAVDRYGQHVAPFIEYLLLAIAVVIIDIEHGDLSIATQKLRRHGGIIEIAKSPEGTLFRMMSGRTHQGV